MFKKFSIIVIMAITLSLLTTGVAAATVYVAEGATGTTVMIFGTSVNATPLSQATLTATAR